LFIARSLASSPFGIWVRLVGVHKVRAAEYFLDNIGSLRAADYASVRYEDLCRQPARAMDGILEHLGVVPTETVPWGSRIHPRPPSVTPEVYRKYHQLLRRLEPYLDYHGYEAEPAW
jgi:hypothetical protein